MKILFVCQQYIHSVRWINQLKDSHHEIFIFDCLDKAIHQELKWTNYIEHWSKRKIRYIKGEYLLEKKAPKLFEKVEPFLKITASEKLLEIINQIQPDLVHSLEMQSETYPLIKVRQKISFHWAYSSWGSDIYVYKNQSYHRKKLQKVFSKLNFLFVDNHRDVKLSKDLGFNNTVSGVFPGGGGYNLKRYKDYIVPIEDRNLILIKGYHHWAGRALFVLDAIENIVERIKDFDVYVYSAHPIVIEKIHELNNKYHLNIKYSSRYNQISQKDLLEKFGKAKIAIGNNISDGIPNTLLEAIILGAFPIQSNPGKVTEDYIENNKNGFLIAAPEKSEEIANHIINAISNNELLAKAFKVNQEIAKNLEEKMIREKVLVAYQTIENSL
mgnify:CR=1 FL=1